jgi:methylenetetrahydrofolate reductase (NADPH)
MKIIDKIKRSADAGEKVFSFEFFPPKTENGVQNLYVRINRLAQLEPTWIDVTWPLVKWEKTLDIAVNAQKFCGVDVLMHLTCTNMTKEKLRQVLQTAKDAGIENILALRGDRVRGAEKWTPCEGGLNGALELVQFIREEFGDWFCIAVAGYPEGHYGEKSYATDVQWLKKKLEAGADFVLTQLFYSPSAYEKYLSDCKEAGITAPIIPGIMPIMSYNTFNAMTTYCLCSVPPELDKKLAESKDDDNAIRKIGIDVVTELSIACLAAGAPGLHFYTMNLENSVRAIINNMGLIATPGPSPSTTPPLPDAPPRSPLISASDGYEHNYGASVAAGNMQSIHQISDGMTSITVGERAATRRKFPWRASALSTRSKETVRPIFWANRPKSYMARTDTWDEYPNGRWGNSNSPAFGDLGDTHFFHFNSGSKSDRKSQWNEAPVRASDVYEVFASYVEGKVKRLPWCTESLQLETVGIIEKLGRLNRNGFLTINSQPAVNSMPSDHPVYGWGGPGGRVYQKAYIEFFCSPKRLGHFMATLEEMPSTSLTYHAIDIHGNSYTNCTTGSTCAVTWGIFPGMEALQPTVVDPDAFKVWKDEAFSLWLSEWACLYNDESKSAELIYDIHNTYYLVNVVDNNFVNGDLFEVFESINVKYPESSSSEGTSLGSTLG